MSGGQAFLLSILLLPFLAIHVVMSEQLGQTATLPGAALLMAPRGGEGELAVLAPPALTFNAVSGGSGVPDLLSAAHGMLLVPIHGRIVRGAR